MASNTACYQKHHFYESEAKLDVFGRRNDPILEFVTCDTQPCPNRLEELEFYFELVDFATVVTDGKLEANNDKQEHTSGKPGEVRFRLNQLEAEAKYANYKQSQQPSSSSEHYSESISTAVEIRK